MIRVLVSGSGKMGRAIVEHLGAEPDLDIVGVVDKFAGDPIIAPGGAPVPMYSDAVAACDGSGADVVVDFTNAAWTPELAAAALPRGIRPVIGTTGLTEQYVAELAAACRERKLGGVVAANFAIGAVLMMHMARIAAPFFESAEIIEMHHAQKVDAPSGTALATARGMIEARGGRPFARNQPEAEPLPGARSAAHDGVTLHSVRLPGYVAHQEVLFGGLGQTLSIRHDTSGRDSFMPGIALATREVMRREELVIGLASLVGLTD
jgi:4-hydroxy-tetrahydrodipicolinate reductase